MARGFEKIGIIFKGLVRHLGYDFVHPIASYSC